MNVILTLNFEYIERIFAVEEYMLKQGEKIYYTKRLMLSTIFNQLPIQCKEVIMNKYQKVCEVLTLTNMIKIN
jgi:hypothetical protein